ncbi:MAG: cupin domain-containing protein [Cyclobacteriaceae bacterium]|nr:cupin domain-containing protein [Cyclobacteriaceae bacterium SS2]
MNAIKYPIILLFSLVSFTIYSQSKTITSRVFDWDEIENQDKVFTGNSDGFTYLDIAVKTIEPKGSLTIPGTGIESLVIMKSGKLDQQVGKQKASLGKGSITLVHSNKALKLKNKGAEESVFYLIQWKGINEQLYDKAPYPDAVMVDWDTVTFQETSKGGRRNIMRQPTPMLNEFEMHTTTLNEGLASHPPHTHLDEEIILVRFGRVEESIDGDTYPADEGSFIFLRSMVPHGIRNIGEGQCEYYAFRWIPRE